MKYWNYLKYILRHKWYVLWECFRYRLYWRGLVHDLSKLLPSEFFPYAEFFYGKHRWIRGSDNRPPSHIDDAFDIAWLKHLHRNPHHWQHWIRYGDDGTTRVFKMPVKCQVEMICDWIGTGMAIARRREIHGWYTKNHEKMLLHPETRYEIEKYIIQMEKVDVRHKHLSQD